MLIRLRREYGQFITSGAQLLVLAIGIKSETRTGWLVSLGLLAVIGLIAWTSTFRRRRAITDTPTSRIASAAQGYVELSGQGRALDDPPLYTPLTQAPCLWYRFQIEERSGQNKWQTIDSGESDVPFILEDGSGRCVIDPDGAEILTQHQRTWQENGYRKTEWALKPDDPLYALGDFRTLGGAAQDFDTNRDLGLLLAEWKKNRPELLRRFDLDRDGTLSEKEWLLARQAARREVARQHQEARAADDVHTLRLPQSGQLYLISNLDPRAIARRYLGWSLFHLASFFAALAALPWAWRLPH